MAEVDILEELKELRILAGEEGRWVECARLKDIERELIKDRDDKLIADHEDLVEKTAPLFEEAERVSTDNVGPEFEKRDTRYDFPDEEAKEEIPNDEAPDEGGLIGFRAFGDEPIEALIRVNGKNYGVRFTPDDISPVSQDLLQVSYECIAEVALEAAQYIAQDFGAEFHGV